MRSVLAVIGVLFRPWRDSMIWWGLVHLLLNIVGGAVTFIPLVMMMAMSVALLFIPLTWPFAVALLWFLFLGGRIVGHVGRSRYAALLGVDLADPVPRLERRRPWDRFLERFRVGARWREIAYGTVLLPFGFLTFFPAMLAWCGSAALVGLPLYVDGLPGDTAKFGLFELGSGPGVFLAAAVGITGLAVVAPWLTVALTKLDVALGRRLLGPSGRDEMRRRVTRLETSRVAAVDSAEAERRRIERDLHDGAQQRLVALAMGLGAARERLESDPERGRQLVDEAHDEAKAALRELRDLVRGIHPVILEDRGLDAALSAVVARSPVPVRLQVEVSQRPTPAVESTAYFVVNEALTNIARHAKATEAHVSIVRSGDRLIVEVRDDGVGGADADKGTGLTGLRNRVAAHDGRMWVVSPQGGPTSVLVEIPCGS